MDRTGDHPQRADGGRNGGWEAHEAEQARYMASLPLDEKLRWLEEAHELALLILGREGFDAARDRRVGETGG
jgi:hypothetical protein